MPTLDLRSLGCGWPGTTPARSGGGRRRTRTTNHSLRRVTAQCVSAGRERRSPPAAVPPSTIARLRHQAAFGDGRLRLPLPRSCRSQGARLLPMRPQLPREPARPRGRGRAGRRPWPRGGSRLTTPRSRLPAHGGCRARPTFATPSTWPCGSAAPGSTRPGGGASSPWRGEAVIGSVAQRLPVGRSVAQEPHLLTSLAPGGLARSTPRMRGIWTGI